MVIYRGSCGRVGLGKGGSGSDLGGLWHVSEIDAYDSGNSSVA